MAAIETLFSNGFLMLFGNQLNLGIFIFVCFMAMVVFLRIGQEAGMVIFIPVFFLMFEFIPELKLVTAIVLGIIFAIGLLRLTRG